MSISISHLLDMIHTVNLPMAILAHGPKVQRIVRTAFTTVHDVMNMKLHTFIPCLPAYRTGVIVPI